MKELNTKEMHQCHFKTQYRVQKDEDMVYLYETYKGKRESQKLEQIIDGEVYLYGGKGRWYFGLMYYVFRKKDNPEIRKEFGFGKMDLESALYRLQGKVL